jgi:hypothetical protein
MTALLALELRLLWRNMRSLGFLWILLPIIATLQRSYGKQSLESLAGWILMPVMGLCLSAIGTTQSAESIGWLVPLRHAARIWARLVLISALALVSAGSLTTFCVMTGETLREPLVQISGHLGLLIVAGLLLLFIVQDRTRLQHPAVVMISSLAALIPGGMLWIVHFSIGLPAWTIGAEVVALAALLKLSFVVNHNLEPTTRALFLKEKENAPLPHSPPDPVDRGPEHRPEATIAARPAASPLTRASRATLDRRPSVGPIISGGFFSYWLIHAGWLAISFIPEPVIVSILGFFAFSVLLKGVLSHWAPFQAAPISRPRVLLQLHVPLLTLWAVTVAIQCGTLWYHAPTILNRYGDRFSLPTLKRENEVSLPAIFRDSTDDGARQFPSDRKEVAALMSRGLRVSYGLDIPADDILAIRNPGTPNVATPSVHADWLREVERRWEWPIRRRLLQWRLVMGLFVLVTGLLTVMETLPGRSPPRIVRTLHWIVAVICFLPLFALSFGKVFSMLPKPVLEFWARIFDGPWILLTGMAAVVVILLGRHAVAFCRSAVISPAE